MDSKKSEYAHQEYLSDDKLGTPPISDADVPSFEGARTHGFMTAEEKHAALEQAQRDDPGVPFADRRFMVYILTVLCVCLCGGGEPQSCRIVHAGTRAKCLRASSRLVDSQTAVSTPQSCPR